MNVRVYLDQADWSYLADNRSPETARVLRRLAADGAITLLLSEIHLIETHALGADFARRDQSFRRDVITGDLARFGAM